MWPWYRPQYTYTSILSSFIQRRSFYLEWLCIYRCLGSMDAEEKLYSLLLDPLGPLAKGGTASLSITGTNVVRHMLNKTTACTPLQKEIRSPLSRRPRQDSKQQSKGL